MKNRSRIIFSLYRKTTGFILFLSVIVLSIPNGVSHQQDASPSVDAELSLLRAEHYLYLTATEQVGIFHLRFVFPPDYDYQTPLLVEFHLDSTSPLPQYKIENDTQQPNTVLNFTLGPLEKNQLILLHFSYWVLVRNHDFNDLPTKVSFPKQLPENVTAWLSPTPVVQADAFLIKHKARQLKGFSTDMIRYADRVASFIKQHRYGLFVLQLQFDTFFSQDALTTLFINGENVGRSHLACALFRAQHVPARVLLALNDQGFWTQMHYMAEYYVPGYGWVLLDPTQGETPYETNHQIILRVCTTDDENNTKPDYIFPYMTGEERWIWSDTLLVEPVYIDCDNASKSQMFHEATTTSSPEHVTEAVQKTKTVYRYYQRYLGMNLTGENLTLFINAIHYQKAAIHALNTSEPLENYTALIDQAIHDYEHINV